MSLLSPLHLLEDRSTPLTMTFQHDNVGAVSVFVGDAGDRILVGATLLRYLPDTEAHASLSLTPESRQGEPLAGSITQGQTSVGKAGAAIGVEVVGNMKQAEK